MAKFLTTEGVSKELSDIIKDATECLVLISPFLKFNERIKEFLAEKNRQNEEFLAEKDRKLLQRIRERINNRQEIDIHVIYGKEKLKPEEKEWLKSMTSIRTKFRKNLHAKCYLNENKALLTSMNLYEFSQVNNDEMGLLVLKEEEPKLYNEIYTESMRIVEVSQEESSEARNTRETPEGRRFLHSVWRRHTRQASSAILQKLLYELEAVQKRDIQGKELPHVRKRVRGNPTQAPMPHLLQEV